MYKLAYVSQAAEGLTRDDVQSIVDHAAIKNADWDITGFLCLRDGVFLQYLEGDESAVSTLFETIRNDPRHAIITVARLGHQHRRNFAHWRMQFLDDHQLGQVAAEDILEGILLELGRGTADAKRIESMADHMVSRIAAAAG